MLYLADLHRDGLLKVGITRQRRERARQSQLRAELGEPRLEVFVEIAIPYGWGTDREWEKRLLANLRSRSNRLQLFAADHISTEVIEATRDEAWTELSTMLRKTHVDPKSTAVQLDPTRVDARFEGFLQSHYPKCREPSSQYWHDVILRQTFLYWLRDEPIARWERISLGFSCSEIDDFLEIESGSL